MVFNDDQSLLISGSEDGCVRVWSLFMYMIILAFLFFCLAHNSFAGYLVEIIMLF